jgi:tyrocidine synthetase-3
MYTSGTTGKPKGSIIPQNGVVRLIRNTNFINLRPEDRILLTGAIVFDATTFEIWGALLNGGTLYIVDKEVILDARTLGEELKKNEITVLWLTAPLFTQLAEESTSIFSELKYLFSGGDVLSPPHVNKVRHDNPSLKFINAYGPTENSSYSTTYQIEKDFEHNIPIGKPISNSTTYIFDKDLKYVPVGVIGELYVGGDGLSLGYLNRDDLNKSSFIYNPHKPTEKLYKTGDYARWLTDGNIEFHGRMDNQIKIRGFRVEMGEIESIISEIDGIVETVIKPVKIQAGDTRLAAFMNVNETFRMDVKELDSHLKNKFPSYMVPSFYKIMKGFPKTINGKIDKDALKLDSIDLAKQEEYNTYSLSVTEKAVYQIFSDILKLKEISVSDNFFDIGGNSLMAMSVHSRLMTTFNLDLELRTFFDSPRIKDLSEIIDIRIKKTASATPEGKSKKPVTRIVEGEI